MSRHHVELIVNGVPREGSCEARMTLADFLREELGLTGTHLGCEHGVCGACTVLLDGAAVRSCLTFAVQASHRSVETVEGLGTPDAMHPIQQAFYEAMSFQCGFCTPGFIMTTVAFLRERSAAGELEPLDDRAIREMLGGNLCRCTGYQSIVEGVRLAVERADAAQSEGAA
jgi:aerobic-type carbon monoxide dehydrogenase small subunit (CoxS/CutS family)